jgi:hypothetical protein
MLVTAWVEQNKPCLVRIKVKEQSVIFRRADMRCIVESRTGFSGNIYYRSIENVRLES